MTFEYGTVAHVLDMLGGIRGECTRTETAVVRLIVSNISTDKALTISSGNLLQHGITRTLITFFQSLNSKASNSFNSVGNKPPISHITDLSNVPFPLFITSRLQALLNLNL